MGDVSVHADRNKKLRNTVYDLRKSCGIIEMKNPDKVQERNKMTKTVEEELQEQIAQQRSWERLSYEQKNKQLFLRQKKLLDTFLERHAISQAQYNKSLGDLQAKTGFTA